MNMKCKTFFSSLLIAIIVFVVATTHVLVPSINAQEGYKLKRINLEGNVTFSTKRLLEQMVMRSNGGLRRLLFWKEPYRYSENVLQRDLKRLVRFYQAEGFLHVKTDYILTKDDEHETVNLMIKILEGNPIVINEIHYELITRGSEDQQSVENVFKKIEPSLMMKQGIRFRDQAVEQDEQTIVKAFSNKGYPYAQVRVELQVNRKANIVDPTIYIETGPKCVFGNTEIIGNKIAPIQIIHKKLAFQRDQIFSQQLIQKSQREIYKLGVFQYVTLKVPIDENRTVLPVQVDVKEAPRLTTKFGVGYGKEDMFRTFVDLRYLGFLGGIRRLSFFAKHSGLEPYHFNVKFVQPRFMTGRTSLTINPFIKREKEPGFKIDRVGNNFILQHNFSTYVDGYINHTFEHDNLSVSSITREQALNNTTIKLYNKSSIAIGLAHDNSSPAFFPNKGMFNAITFTLSGIGFKSDFHFMRLLLEFRRYKQIVEGWIFAYRTKWGWMNPTSGDLFTPIEERFYAGGSSSVRGWERSQLGPKSDEGRPLGGNSYLEGSGELRFPIWRKLSGVTFIDFGNVWQRSSGYVFSELHYAGGLGLRFKTPIGPIRFDVAVPIFEDKKPVQFHISVGQSF